MSYCENDLRLDNDDCGFGGREAQDKYEDDRTQFVVTHRDTHEYITLRVSLSPLLSTVSFLFPPPISERFFHHIARWSRHNRDTASTSLLGSCSLGAGSRGP